MAFRGWPAEALEFFEGLEADNSRAYWQDHTPVYEAAVRGPMDELLAELAPEFGAGKVFRPHRDVRFSSDKTPYKTHLGAVLEKGGYVQLSAEGLACGLGYWHMSADQLDRFRQAVAAEPTGAPLAEIAKALVSKGIEVTSIDSLKTAPRGYPKDHPRVELLRHKGLAAYRKWPVAAWLGTKAAKTRAVEFLRTAQPLVTWLDDNVGQAATGSWLHGRSRPPESRGRPPTRRRPVVGGVFVTAPAGDGSTDGRSPAARRRRRW